MCRLFAVRSESPVPVRRAFDRLKEQSREHKDGWGVARFDPQPLLEFGLSPAHQDDRFDALGATLASTALLAHLRLASVGGLKRENAHPFFAHGWAFMHNGTVTNFRRHRARVEQAIHPDYRRFGGETDTERCFGLFLTEIMTRPRPPSLVEIAAALARTMTTVSGLCDRPGPGGRSSMNFLVSDGRRLVATRRGRSLFTSSVPKARFIASEVLWSDGHWDEVPENGIVAVDEDLSVSRFKVSDFV